MEKLLFYYQLNLPKKLVCSNTQVLYSVMAANPWNFRDFMKPFEENWKNIFICLNFFAKFAI